MSIITIYTHSRNIKKYVWNFYLYANLNWKFTFPANLLWRSLKTICDLSEAARRRTTTPLPIFFLLLCQVSSVLPTCDRCNYFETRSSFGFFSLLLTFNNIIIYDFASSKMSSSQVPVYCNFVVKEISRLSFLFVLVKTQKTTKKMAIINNFREKLVLASECLSSSGVGWSEWVTTRCLLCSFLSCFVDTFSNEFFSWFRPWGSKYAVPFNFLQRYLTLFPTIFVKNILVKERIKTFFYWWFSFLSCAAVAELRTLFSFVKLKTAKLKLLRTVFRIISWASSRIVGSGENWASRA